MPSRECAAALLEMLASGAGRDIKLTEGDLVAVMRHASRLPARDRGSQVVGAFGRWLQRLVVPRRLWRAVWRRR